MARSTATALKQYAESLSYGFQWFVDSAPLQQPQNGLEQPLPYAVIQDNLDRTRDRTGDGKTNRLRELIQVDVYQDPANEDVLLMDRIENDLAAATLPAAPKKVARLQDITGRRIPPMLSDPVVRYTFTATVRRQS